METLENTIPSETTPLETTPLETTPLETTPLETTPLETTPLLQTSILDVMDVSAPEHTRSMLKEALKEDNLWKTMMDLSFDQDLRVKALNMYYQKNGKDQTVEIITKLGLMYEISGTSNLRKYLLAIATESTIDPLLKSFAGKTLCIFNPEDDFGYSALDIVYPQLGLDVGTPYKIELLKLLMRNNTYREKTTKHFCDTITDVNIDVGYRYKCILKLEANLEEEKPQEPVATQKPEKGVITVKKQKKKKEEKVHTVDYSHYIIEGLFAFATHSSTPSRYVILASQNLLNRDIAPERKTEILNILLEIASTVTDPETTEAYNLRADATDTLLQYASGTVKRKAQSIMMKLGNVKRVHTVYDNMQNVHTKEIEESVKDALEFLHSFEIMKIGDVPNQRSITFEYVEEKILELCAERKIQPEGIEPIKVSLNRISMDRALYSKFNCTLINILLRVWTYLIGHTSEEDMKTRLIEELTEMAGTCSSGFAARLINTISGFGNFSVRISWRDQITANLSGRLNARIREMDDLKAQERILEQMMLESSDYAKRKHFLKFFRSVIPDIREEMFAEFKSHISDVDFDLYFRSAVVMYENGAVAN